MKDVEVHMLKFVMHAGSAHNLIVYALHAHRGGPWRIWKIFGQGICSGALEGGAGGAMAPQGWLRGSRNGVVMAPKRGYMSP